MVGFFNFGFILEQALVDLIKGYFDRLNLDEMYSNFHISVVNDHPFAHMIIENNARAADNFPCVVVSTQTDSKVNELYGMPVQAYGIGLNDEEIKELGQIGYRNKIVLGTNFEEKEYLRNGCPIKEKIPGFISVIDDVILKKLIQVAESRNTETEKGLVYGIQYDTRKRDNISIEIWAENNQLKNELYEYLNLFLRCSLEDLFKSKYNFFSPSIIDNSVRGDRSSNYNFDFDVFLTGSHISCEIDYTVTQIILDTEVSGINKNLCWEVINHVKE